MTVNVSPATEEWRSVPGYEGLYEVSDQGRVRNAAGHILTPYRIWSGYTLVKLRKNREGKGLAIHRLVARAFLGERGNGLQVNHINGQRDDNRLSNLSWVTAAENCQHKVVTGTDMRGERHHNARLSNDDVIQIRRLRNAGEKGADIARQFNVTRQAIWRIEHRRGWTHI